MAIGDAPQSEIQSNKLILSFSVWKAFEGKRRRNEGQRTTHTVSQNISFSCDDAVTFHLDALTLPNGLCAVTGIKSSRVGRMDTGNNSFTILDPVGYSCVCRVCLVSGAQTCNKSNTHFLLLIALGQSLGGYLLAEPNISLTPGSMNVRLSGRRRFFAFCSPSSVPSHSAHSLDEYSSRKWKQWRKAIFRRQMAKHFV